MLILDLYLNLILLVFNVYTFRYVVVFLCGSDIFLRLHNSYNFVTILHGPWNVVTHLLSEDIGGYFLFNFFETQPQEYPNPWLLISKTSTQLVRRWSRYRITSKPVVTLVLPFIISAVLIFVLLLFQSFLYNLPVDYWAWSFIVVSEHLFFYTNIFLQMEIKYAYSIRLVLITYGNYRPYFLYRA